MKKSYLKVLICSAVMVGVFVVTAISSYGTWLLSFHQRECPKALIRED